jgi:hypothetical protein
VLKEVKGLTRTVGCYALSPLLPSILVDSGATHVLLRESVLPSLAHLMRPAKIPPIPFPFPNGSILTAQSGGHLHFPRFPFPVPLWSAPDASLPHFLLAISPLLQTSGSCLLTPTTLSIFASGSGRPDTRSCWLKTSQRECVATPHPTPSPPTP